jgi:hypothetical protein
MLAGFTLLFLMPDAMSDEGPGPQVGFAGNYDTDGHAVNVVVSGIKKRRVKPASIRKERERISVRRTSCIITFISMH